MLGLKLNHVSKRGPWGIQPGIPLSEVNSIYWDINKILETTISNGFSRNKYFVSWLKIHWLSMDHLRNCRLFGAKPLPKQHILCYTESARHIFMMTPSKGNIFHVTDPLWGESIGHRWNPLTKASDAELWRFLWSAPEQTVGQRIETPVIWDAIALIMTSL